MKNSLLIVVLLLPFLLFSQYQKIPVNSVSKEVILYANQFLTNIYINNKVPKLKPKDATAYFRKALVEAKVLKNVKRFDDIYGKVVDISFVEIVQNNNSKVLRYKVKRDETNRSFELRIGLNEKDKFTFLWNKRYWSDKYHDFYENPKQIPLDTNMVSQKLRLQNYAFATKSYQKCERDKLFNIDSTNMVFRALKSGFNKNQLKECDSIKLKLGNFKNVKFKQVLTDSVFTKVYRYSAKFDKLERPSEIRIYTNLDDMYKGVFIIDAWFDKYFDHSKAIEKSRNLLGN